MASSSVLELDVWMVYCTDILVTTDELNEQHDEQACVRKSLAVGSTRVRAASFVCVRWHRTEKGLATRS